MSTIKTFAEKYNITVAEVKNIARKKCNFIPLSDTYPLSYELEEKLDKALKFIPPPIHNPQPVSEIFKAESQTSTKYQSVPPPIPVPQPVSKSLKNEDLLSRNYIVFTLSVLEKASTYKVLKNIIELRKTKNTNTKLIVVSAAIDELKTDAEADKPKKYLMKNYQLFNTMREKGWIIVLDGNIAQEGMTIAMYIRNNCRNSDSILILGKNMTLDTYIFLRNKGNAKKWDYKNPVYQDGYIPIEECGIKFNGDLTNVKYAGDPVFGPVGEERSVKVKSEKNANEVCKPVVNLIELSEAPIFTCGKIPTEGDLINIKDNNGRWKTVILYKEVSHGAEGAVYNLEDDAFCAKILFAQSRTERKLKKIELMCQRYEELRSRDNSIMRRIAWPQKIVFNDKYEPVGYIMPKFTDVTGFDNFNTMSYGDFIRNSKENQIISAVSFVELIRFLHENNIVLCDINRGNILYDSKQRAYLVDLDSAQITEKEPFKKENGMAYYYCYPSNVAAPQFISPEHVDEKYYTFRHSKADDVWSVQYMIFLLLTCCGAFLPYNNDAGSPEGKKDIREGRYLYYFNYRNNIPESDPLFRMHCIVSRLPSYLQKAFYNSFSGKGSKFNMHDRNEVKIWMIWLINYYIELPEIIRADAEDGEYLPETIKYSTKDGGNSYNHNVESILNEIESWFN